MIRLAIAEPNTIVRWALREALSRVDDIEVVAAVGTAAETLDMVQRDSPDVLLIGLLLPDRAGLDVVAELRLLDGAPLVIVLGTHADGNLAARAIAAGAHGYLGESEGPEALVEAIRAVARGEPVAPPAVEHLVAANPAASLTAREQQVMEMLGRGMTNREIAEHLAISIKTVDTHRGHVLKKLGLRNNSELTRFAVRHGYVAL